MPATPVTSSSVASTTNGATRWNGRVTTMSSMSNSIGVLFTWQVLLVLRVDVALAPTSSQVEEHFPRQSHGDDQRGCNIGVRGVLSRLPATVQSEGTSPTTTLDFAQA